MPIGIIAAGILGFVLMGTEEVQEAPRAQPERTWLVNTQTVQKQTLHPSVRLYGRIESPSFSTLSAIVDGEVIEVNVLAGETVEAGDVLIRLDSRNLQTQLRQTNADLDRIRASLTREGQRLTTDQEILFHEKRLLELATESLGRARTLKSRNLISQAEFDTFERTEQQAHLSVTAREASIREYDSRVDVLQAEFKRMEALLDRIELDIEDTVIVAPYAGRVTQVHVALGNQVRNSSPLVSMYDHNRLEVKTLIPNRHIAHLRQAIADDYRLEARAQLDDHLLTLTFDRLASIVDQGRGGVDAYFRVASNPIRPELSRSVDLVLTLTPVHDAIAIPYQAIYGSNQVFKIESGSLKSLSIRRHGQIFLNQQTFLVATSDDLDDGDTLVTTQLTNAVDGLKVQPWNKD